MFLDGPLMNKVKSQDYKVRGSQPLSRSQKGTENSETVNTSYIRLIKHLQKDTVKQTTKEC